jgi:2-(1,2-epoxy-1,2-dihydrophenyl)acetyl-CoA isomerase
MSIKTKFENGVMNIILSRPDVLNSFNREMALSFQRALDDAERNPEIRAILISAEGRAFCAGQDLSEAIQDNGLELKQIVSEHYNPIIMRLRKIGKPIIASVGGVAAGAGANIALACDIVIASERASFIQAFSQIGLIPDSGGTFILPRLVGLAQATALMMTAEKVSAADAVKMGMIWKCVPDDELKSASLSLAEKLAKMPTKGLGFTKECLNKSLNSNLTDQLACEEEMQDEAGKTGDYKEGVQAFLEKRKPNFKGN